MVTHVTTNRAQCRLTTLIKANVLTTTLRRHHKLLAAIRESNTLDISRQQWHSQLSSVFTHPILSILTGQTESVQDNTIKIFVSQTLQWLTVESNLEAWAVSRAGRGGYSLRVVREVPVTCVSRWCLKVRNVFNSPMMAGNLFQMVSLEPTGYPLTLTAMTTSQWIMKQIFTGWMTFLFCPTNTGKAEKT